MHCKRSTDGALIFVQGSIFGHRKIPTLDGRTEAEINKTIFKYLCIFLCYSVLISVGCSAQGLFSEVWVSLNCSSRWDASLVDLSRSRSLMLPVVPWKEYPRSHQPQRFSVTTGFLGYSMQSLCNKSHPYLFWKLYLFVLSLIVCCVSQSSASS